ncbi:fibronectin type III domain-containing protein [Aquimarina macrocephali]|uniref:fibronectin type III domain-containing protein n=1 Tax=Aquimarina macrocephali TaxID=666563 RepID=UPI000463F0F6|nr:fibronectin type III domain-containing protein [Aquimarina macrocephali]
MKKQPFLYSLIILCLSIVGCNNDDDKVIPPASVENQVPGDFTIQVSQITDNSALLEWTAAVDPDDDKVTYSVFLGDNEVQSNLETTEFLLEGLIAETNYNGKVVASDGNENESENTFTFITEGGEIINEEVSIAWQKSLGGTFDDEAYEIEQTSDGGYIIGGSSESTDGDVGGNKGGKDCWIIKLDSLGNIEWETNLGGSNNETIHGIQQTMDGGYIVGAFSTSSDGDVGGNNGMRDFWIVKLNASGNLVWETNLGGTSDDILESIQQTSDGGYVAVGFSLSGNGNVTGNNGKADAWIVRLDETGNLVWETNLGGPENDFMGSIDQTIDLGFIVAGYTTTENKRDLWIAKLDDTGNLDWQKTLGGSENEEAVSVEQTIDSGYIIGGYSTSVDGDVGENKGSADAWIIKLNVTGDLLWEKTLGGSGSDGVGEIKEVGGGYIAVGSTNSLDGDLTSNNGARDFWILRLDTFGNIIWQESLGGPGDDYGFSIQQTADNGYIVAGTWYTNIMGAGEGTTGDFNYWIIKLE